MLDDMSVASTRSKKSDRNGMLQTSPCRTLAKPLSAQNWIACALASSPCTLVKPRSRNIRRLVPVLVPISRTTASRFSPVRSISAANKRRRRTNHQWFELDLCLDLVDRAVHHASAISRRSIDMVSTVCCTLSHVHRNMRRWHARRGGHPRPAGPSRAGPRRSAERAARPARCAAIWPAEYQIPFFCAPRLPSGASDGPAASTGISVRRCEI